MFFVQCFEIPDPLKSDVRKEVCSSIGPRTTSSSFAVAKAWSHHGFIHLCVL